MNVIITGASRGVGYELVRHFAGDGPHTIYAISRNRERLEILKQNCLKDFPSAEIRIAAIDLSNAAYIQEFAGMLKSENQSIDVLVNNAGALVNKPFESLTASDFDQVFDVNVKSVFQLIRDVKPMMKAGSHIVNISSMGGFQGSSKFPGLSLYSASKGAVAILTECLAEEFKNDKVSVNCLAIGAVQTEMLAQAFPGYEAPLKASEMAAYLLDFAKNGHHFYNGKILPVSLSTP